MVYDFEGPDGGPIEDIEVSPPRGSANRGRRQRKEEEFMEGIRGGLDGGAYVEEPSCSRLDFMEEMDLAAVGTHGGRLSEPRWTSRPGLMVSRPLTPPCSKS